MMQISKSLQLVSVLCLFETILENLLGVVAAGHLLLAGRLAARFCFPWVIDWGTSSYDSYMP